MIYPINYPLTLICVRCQLFVTTKLAPPTVQSEELYKNDCLSSAFSLGRTHGAPYRSYGYVPLRFGVGASLGGWEHNNNSAFSANGYDICDHISIT